ncbi:hypothetical protein I3842_11G130500 [Carya illinoinensis]|uniref:Uncharacterized protein n=1 Tax=Carya illinoinensis TaxID=32201 RepID=A0A922DPU0_CARIL|nr:hypothetical protein I3842_11G130500 [Carya illinoinensis]
MSGVLVPNQKYPYKSEVIHLLSMKIMLHCLHQCQALQLSLSNTHTHIDTNSVYIRYADRENMIISRYRLMIYYGSPRKAILLLLLPKSLLSKKMTMSIYINFDYFNFFSV